MEKLLKKAKRAGGSWKGDIEKKALFCYWMTLDEEANDVSPDAVKSLALSLPPFPNTVAPKKRETDHIHAITSEESVCIDSINESVNYSSPPYLPKLQPTYFFVAKTTPKFEAETGIF